MVDPGIYELIAMRLPCVIVAALSVTAVRIPAQSRFSAIEDARVEALVDQKTKSCMSSQEATLEKPS